MALIPCKECNETVSTEAVSCPHCGAPQQRPVPPPLPTQPAEETIYSDNAVVVTNMRVIIGGATYALRNVTSVKMLFTPPRLVKPILLLIIGLMILLAAFFPINENAPAPASVFVIAGMMIVGAILWMCSAKTKFHVGLSSASGEIHALTSKSRAYIERIVVSINEAILKHR
jgi:RsiW-degrading membrane proteinase PrsW (M82 family)